MAGRQTGFTLVEVIIVVLVLSIVAVLVVPRFTSAAEDARKAALGTNLSILRRQIEIYKSEHKGRGPHLNEAGTPDQWNFIPRLVSRTDIDGKLIPTGEYGPYLLDWPRNVYAPVTVAGAIKFGADPTSPRDDSTGWYFSVTVGTMHVNTTEGPDEP